MQSAAAQKLTTMGMIDIRDCVAKEMGDIVNLDEISIAAFDRTLERIGTPDRVVAGGLFSIY